MACISPMTFPTAFSRMKMLKFRLKFHWNLFLRSSWQKIAIGSGNGLAPTRWQEITWTNAGPIRWRIYAALGGDELTIVTDTNEWLVKITAYSPIGCFCSLAAAYLIGSPLF